MRVNMEFDDLGLRIDDIPSILPRNDFELSCVDSSHYLAVPVSVVPSDSLELCHLPKAR